MSVPRDSSLPYVLDSSLVGSSENEEVPYSADEIAEDCRWHEIQRGTPFKHDLRINNGMNEMPILDTTPLKDQHQLAAQLAAAAGVGSQHPTPTKRIPITFNSALNHPLSMTPRGTNQAQQQLTSNEDDWPFPRVDTWTTVVNTTTPQKPEPTQMNATNHSFDPSHNQQHQRGGSFSNYHHHSSSAWSTDREDEDNDLEVDSNVFGPLSSPPHNMISNMPFNMSRLSLNDEGSNDYNNLRSTAPSQQAHSYHPITHHTQQAQQPQHHLHHQQQANFHHQQSHSQSQSQPHPSHQSHIGHGHYPTPQITYSNQASHSLPVQVPIPQHPNMHQQHHQQGHMQPMHNQHQSQQSHSYQQQVQQQHFNPHLSSQQQPQLAHAHAPMNQQPQQQAHPQQHQQISHLSQSSTFPIRQPSPPPAALTYPGNTLRLPTSGVPSHWHGLANNSSQMTIPAPVLRATAGFQSTTNFAHSTSGPVRGMPTNQVNYNQQQQQQQHQSQQSSGIPSHYSVRGPGTHSQPLTPVGSFVPPSSLAHATGQQSHSHPASPRASVVGSSAFSEVGSSTSSISSYGTTPNLSPLSSPVMSPHSSPQRAPKNQAHMHSSQSVPLHIIQPHPPMTASLSAPNPSLHHMQLPHHHHMRSGSSGISSLSSSGSSTPTSQVGPPFNAQAQAIFNFQAQDPRHQPTQANMMNMGSNLANLAANMQQSAQQQSQQQQQQQQQQQSHQHHMQQPLLPSHSSQSQGPIPSQLQRRPLQIQTHSHANSQPQMMSHFIHPHLAHSQQQAQQQHSQQQQHLQAQSHVNHSNAHSGAQSGMVMVKNNSSSGGMSVTNSSSSVSGSSSGTGSNPSGHSQSTSLTNPSVPVLSGDSPRSKGRFKVFYRTLWSIAREPESPSGSGPTPTERAYEFGLEALKNPDHERIAWKIAMELADLAKRQNHIPRARFWYERAHTLEPLASQVWIEHSKMEEECGELLECERLMEEGLRHCEGNEALLIKAIKHHERMGDLVAARSILAKLKDAPLDRVWRTVLEGGLLEARMGQMQTARRIFKYLSAHVTWYGPIFFEHARVEERWGNFDLALSIAEKGLQQVQRYGPLWFMAFRLIERTCNGDMEQPRLHVQRALSHVSQELQWKCHFELAQMEERLGEFDRAREAYANSIHACPYNLRWKVWLSGARMELLSGDASRHSAVRALLTRALEEVPKKMKYMSQLELSRMHEFLGSLDEARQVLKQAQQESRSEWKVFLESVLLELRAGNVDRAIEEAENALEIHHGTGRLWAILISLSAKQKHRLGHRLGHTNGSMKRQWAIFKRAIQVAPKSGEIWCEGARLVLNPYAPKYFDLKSAKRFLTWGIAFTPQYGDSFIEYLRLKMILEGIEETPLVPETKSTPSVSPLYTAANAAAASTSGSSNSSATDESTKPPIQFHGSGRTTPTNGQVPPVSHFQRVAQLCVNAEPNYGSSWFACKAHPLWAPVEVLDVARKMIEKHLVANQHAYQTAILRNWYAPPSRQVTPADMVHADMTRSKLNLEDELNDAASESGSISSSKMSLASVSEDETDADDADAGDEEEIESAASGDISLNASASLNDSIDSNHSALSSSSSHHSSSEPRLFSPTTVRLARQIENGDIIIGGRENNRSSTPDSISSAFLTSEDDEDDLQPEHQPDAEFNSLHILYPPIASLSIQEKHRCLYGADPITP